VPSKATYKVKELIKDTSDTVEIILECPKLEFKAGQFIMAEFPLENGTIVKRAYSIGSSPEAKDLSLFVKEMPNGQISKMLQTIPIGTEFEAVGPFGVFFFDEEKHKEIILMGAGSGVAPFVSIAQYINDKQLDTKVKVFCSHKTEKDIIARKKLETAAKKNENISLHFHCTRDENWSGECERINEEHIRKACGELVSKFFFLCGPKEFVKGMKLLLLEMGVEKANIKQEVYG